MRRILSLALAATLLAALPACAGTGGEQKRVDLSAFAKTLQEKYEFAGYLSEMSPEYEYFEEDVERALPGLLAMDLEQRVLLHTMININNGEIDLVQAKTPPGRRKFSRPASTIWRATGKTPAGRSIPAPPSCGSTTPRW